MAFIWTMIIIAFFLLHVLGSVVASELLETLGFAGMAFCIVMMDINMVFSLVALLGFATALLVLGLLLTERINGGR